MKSMMHHTHTLSKRSGWQLRAADGWCGDRQERGVNDWWWRDANERLIHQYKGEDERENGLSSLSPHIPTWLSVPRFHLGRTQHSRLHGKFTHSSRFDILEVVSVSKSNRLLHIWRLKWNFKQTQCCSAAERPVKGALHCCWAHETKPNVGYQAQPGDVDWGGW